MSVRSCLSREPLSRLVPAEPTSSRLVELLPKAVQDELVTIS
jgi:hypothetical protein